MAYTLLETVTVGSSGASSIEFDPIEGVDGADLKVLISARSNASGIATEYRFQFNGDTSSVYHTTGIAGDGSTLNRRGVGPTSFLENLSLQKNGATANTFGNAELYISNFSSAQDTYATFMAVSENNATEAYQGVANFYRDVAEAITSIKIYATVGDFVEYTTASLYLVTNADATGATGSFVLPPKATGGTITNVDGYWIHTFTSSGTFTPTESLTCDYLVIAGGGGGGGSQGGGGGAGGYRTSFGTSGGGAGAETALSLSATGYTVTVGAGGTAGGGGSGGTGVSSVFSTITSSGGGGGSTDADGGNGASGGGGSAQGTSYEGGFPSTGQGFAGGAGSNPNGGGGGGAGEAGNTDGQRHGGDGVSSSISGTAVIRAGGGGGGSNGGAPGPGGDGGGGQGTSNNSAGSAGTVNTGGGGGAGGSTAGVGNGTGAAGGSGIVIVRYAA